MKHINKKNPSICSCPLGGIYSQAALSIVQGRETGPKEPTSPPTLTSKVVLSGSASQKSCMTSGPLPWTKSHESSSTAMYLPREELPLSEMFMGHIQHARDLVRLRQFLCLLPSGGEQQVHHSSGHTQRSFPMWTDRLYFIRMRADIDRQREKITVPIN